MEKVNALNFAEDYIVNNYKFKSSTDIDFLVNSVYEWFKFYYRGEFYKPIDLVKDTIDEMVDIYDGLGVKGIEDMFGI